MLTVRSEGHFVKLVVKVERERARERDVNYKKYTSRVNSVTRESKRVKGQRFEVEYVEKNDKSKESIAISQEGGEGER